MAVENHLDPLEDNRFVDVSPIDKKNLHYLLHHFHDDDYFSDELICFNQKEIEEYKEKTTRAIHIFEEVLDDLVRTRSLNKLVGIPQYFHDCIYYSWENKIKNPFLLGRFDFNGGFSLSEPRIIECNADTCSTIPETIHWQQAQFAQVTKKATQYNHLEDALYNSFTRIKSNINSKDPVIIGSTLGYPEDRLNTEVILNLAFRAGIRTFQSDLEHVIFSDDEGIFLETGTDQYEQANVFFKLFPWDWLFNDEPELGEILSKIIKNELCTILNPAYTAVWQNKSFLAQITEKYPEDLLFCKTHMREDAFAGKNYVKKPIGGRLGENISIVKNNAVAEKSKGDYGHQPYVYQEYYPNPKDRENYSYQTGVFYTEDGPCAINVRPSESEITTDDCEFMSHIVTDVEKKLAY